MNNKTFIYKKRKIINIEYFKKVYYLKYIKSIFINLNLENLKLINENFNIFKNKRICVGRCDFENKF